MEICIFPGTFNPIHEGHIKMAEFVVTNLNYDKVIFIPSYIPPHKQVDSDLANHRLEMVKLAIENNPLFDVSDIEYRAEEKSYSIITVKKIIEQYSIKERLNFIIGTDAFVNLKSWYKAEELKDLVHFIVFPRRGSDDKDLIEEYLNNNWDFEVVDMEYVDVSSTDIRKNRDLNLNNRVREYIKENELY